MSPTPLLLHRADIDRMITILADRGYEVIGPTVRKQEHIISYGEVSSTDDLPIGMGDEQEAGKYRLVARGDDKLFGYVLTDASPISYLLPAEAVVWAGKRNGNGFETVERPAPPRYAFIGVRPCELAAVAIQDTVFLNASYALDLNNFFHYMVAREMQPFAEAAGCAEPIYGTSIAGRKSGLDALKSAAEFSTKARECEQRGNIADAFYWWRKVFNWQFSTY